ISETRIDRSVNRILRYKKKYIIDQSTKVPSLEMVGCASHRRFEEKIAQQSITIVKNDAGIIPVSLEENSKVTVIYPETMPLLRREDLSDDMNVLVAEIKKRNYNINEVKIGLEPEQDDIRKAVKAGKDAELIIVATSSKKSIQEEKQGALVRSLNRLGNQLIAVAIRNPYDIRYYPEVKTYLTTYGYREPSIRAAVSVIFGEMLPHGKLPVNLSGIPAL
ncbi:MAG TPA: glycoside hydrolase family 3 C-terminal domain-containing protein, partial [Halanaerobiales bacterium]|nr:glycoside hydrolase family 3 C-terminal domain-containing protein [Halanaerobiales bacterium]